MGTLTLQSPIQALRKRSQNDKPPFMRPFRTGLSLPAEMDVAARNDDILLHNTRRSVYDVQTDLDIKQSHTAPLQIGRAARHISNHAGPSVEGISVTPRYLGLKGPSIKILRKDLENTVTKNHGSPQEIWRNTQISQSPAPDQLFADRLTANSEKLFSFTLRQDLSLSEEDNGILYRTSGILSNTRQISQRLHLKSGLRFNFIDNLDTLHDLRPRSLLPVRNDVDAFSDERVTLDTSMIAWTNSIGSDIHIAASAGYLEEMYAGIGGEILYRPFGRTYALGIEGYQTIKRDPATAANLGLVDQAAFTGFINGWYEVPNTGLTFKAKAGRYLQEDFGGTLSLKHHFQNGTSIEGFVTATDSADFDLFGDQTHLYSGVNFNIPLYTTRYPRLAGNLDIRISQIGRDSGQALESPMNLYEITEPFSYRHIARHWNDVIE